MTTTQTDAIMALADRYAFHIPGSQHSDEARAVLLAALQELAREGEAVAWNHGCNALCTSIDLWIDRCPHCGKPRPAAPAPQPAQPHKPLKIEVSKEQCMAAAQMESANQPDFGPSEPAQPEQGPST